MKRILLLGAAALGLAACEPAVKAPTDRGVCWHVVLQGEGEPPRFNKVAENQPQIEYCAARLEELRLQFLRRGGSRQSILGAYQGQFLFVNRGGVRIAKRLDGGSFQLLTRTGDGRLAIPGVIPTAPETAAPAMTPPAAPAG